MSGKQIKVIQPPLRTIVIMHESCGVCGVDFGIEQAQRNALMSSGKAFYCPNGCKVAYEGDIDELKRKLNQQIAAHDQTRARLADERRRYEAACKRAETAKRSRAAMKGQLTKIKKRIVNGVCPCCNRYFKQLDAHMKRMHPGYTKHDDER
jgi:hypothetical protein